MTEITIDRVAAEGSTIRCSVECDGRLRRFFTGAEFLAEYDVDVEDVPESIAVVPVLAQVCPVAWAVGADVRVRVVDAEFLAALDAVGNELLDMYPSFMQGGAIRVGEAVENESPAREDDRPAMLFSGGVDSVTTYLRHRTEVPALVSVQGWVVRRDEPERWARVRRQVEAFAEPRGLRTHDISSNMLEFVDSPMLQAHFQRYLDGAWYSSVGHGLGMLGLCAPLTFEVGYPTLYIAATHTEAFTEPWGSHPRIDDRVRWSGTEAVHDGYDLSRQEKLELIADYVRGNDQELTLRTCLVSEAGENCNECEKCYRTAVGLLLAGVDPNDVGYDVDRSTFADIRAAFERGEFTMGEHERYMWQDLKDHLPPEWSYSWPEVEQFFDWLAAADLDELVDRSDRRLVDQVVQAGMRHTPQPVYTNVYSVYNQVRTATRSR